MTIAPEQPATASMHASQRALTIAVVTGGIPHYRWPFFSELADRGASVRLIAAGKLPPGISATQPPDERIMLTELPSARPRWRSDVVAELRRIEPDVVLLEHGSALDYAWTTLLSRSIKAPRIFWTHGIARQELYGGKRGLASWGRWAQLRLGDGIVCYDAQMAERMARHYPNKVVGTAPNSTDGRAIVAERVRCESEGRDAVRRGLGLSAQFYLAGLGRLVAEKNFARLLRVCAALRRGGLDVGVILIGGGPEEEALRREAQTLGMRVDRDAVFAGPVTKPAALARWLFAADACVSPGPLGLSAVDCLFAGVPVVSYEPSVDGIHHGPEWRYLRGGVTGYFASANTDDALATVCREYLMRGEAKHDEARRACAAHADERLGIASMADGMLKVINAMTERSAAQGVRRS